jgi:hypothetical protein
LTAAKRRKDPRHPREAASRARGRVAVRAPVFPREETTPVTVAKDRGGYQLAARVRVPMYMQDIPSPFNPLPNTAMP